MSGHHAGISRCCGLLLFAALAVGPAVRPVCAQAEPDARVDWQGTQVDARHRRWLDQIGGWADAQEQQRGFLLADLRFAGAEATAGLTAVFEDFAAVVDRALSDAGAARMAAEARDRVRWLRGDLRQQLEKFKGEGAMDVTTPPGKYVAADLVELDRMRADPSAWALQYAKPLAPRAPFLAVLVEILEALGAGAEVRARWDALRTAWRARLPRAAVFDHPECSRFLEENAATRQANTEAARELPEAAREIIAATNDYRHDMGLRVLALDARLTAAAQGHSEEMTRLDYFSHNSPTRGRRDVGQRVELAGVKPVIAGENIARGNFTPREIVDAWRDSPGHHRNLIHAQFKRLGVWRDGKYWTAVYAGEDRR